MAGGVDGCYAWDDFIAGLDECRTVGQGQADLDVQLAIEFPRLADVLAALPEVEIGGAEDIAGLRKDRFSSLGQPADVIGVPVRENDDVDVFGLVAGGGKSRRGLSWRQPLAELFVFAWQCTIACIEQDELL